MKVLVVGSGGREHAVIRKLAENREITKLYCAPGNGGISVQAENVDIKGRSGHPRLWTQQKSCPDRGQ